MELGKKISRYFFSKQKHMLMQTAKVTKIFAITFPNLSAQLLESVVKEISVVKTVFNKPGQLSRQSMRLLISGSWVRAPRWAITFLIQVYQTFKRHLNVPGGVQAPSVSTNCPFTSSFSSISTMDSFVGASWNEVTFS